MMRLDAGATVLDETPQGKIHAQEGDVGPGESASSQSTTSRLSGPSENRARQTALKVTWTWSACSTWTTTAASRSRLRQRLLDRLARAASSMRSPFSMKPAGRSRSHGAARWRGGTSECGPRRPGRSRRRSADSDSGSCHRPRRRSAAGGPPAGLAVRRADRSSSGSSRSPGAGRGTGSKGPMPPAYDFIRPIKTVA